MAVPKAEQMAADWAWMKAGYLDAMTADQLGNKKAALMVAWRVGQMEEPLERRWVDPMAVPLAE